MDLLDKNILIATFLGMEQHEDGFYDKGNLLSDYAYLKEQGSPYSNLYFHYSWDWLMPVASKFLSLRGSRGLYFQYSEHTYNIEEAIVKFNRQQLFEALVEGIEWYNKEGYGTETIR